jgi:hypothetical protein
MWSINNLRANLGPGVYMARFTSLWRNPMHRCWSQEDAHKEDKRARSIIA